MAIWFQNNSDKFQVKITNLFWCSFQKGGLQIKKLIYNLKLTGKYLEKYISNRVLFHFK